MVYESTASEVREPLSDRHREILSLIVEGKSNKEIADELKIKAGTVKQHLFVLFRKLGVSSRAKAVLVAEQFLKNSFTNSPSERKAPKKSKLGLSLEAEKRYDWRLVSAVAVTIPEEFSFAESPEDVLRRDDFLNELQAYFNGLVSAFDGSISILPDGGMLAWFGHPIAHLDDAERAVQLAQYLQAWSESYLSASPDTSYKPYFGIGVGSHTEVVAGNTTQLFGAESFRKASALARHAQSLRKPLSDALTKRLAPACTPWLEIKTKADGKSVMVKGVGDIVIVGPSNGALHDISGYWDGLPFMAKILEEIQRGVAQWVAIESWPPLQASSLIDAIGNYAFSRQMPVLRLRSPSNQRRDQLLNSYTTQVENMYRMAGLKEKKLFPNAGERLAGLLADLANLGPLVVELYGLKALDGFKWVIGEGGIDRLASKPILIVAANLSDTGVAKTTLRLLGPRPNEQPFSRVFSMQMPEMNELPEGIRVDLQAMIDGLGALAKSLIIEAAHHPGESIEGLLATMSDSHHKTQASLHELTSLGLIAPKQGGGFEFRDLTTAQAIKKLSITIPLQETT